METIGPREHMEMASVALNRAVNHYIELAKANPDIAAGLWEDASTAGGELNRFLIRTRNLQAAE